MDETRRVSRYSILSSFTTMPPAARTETVSLVLNKMCLQDPEDDR